jgi:cyclin-dependent kinase-like
LVFEFVDKNLFEVISQFHPRGMRSEMTRSLILQLVRAVSHCHNNGFIHRDVKPENILVSLSDMTVKLCDFGFARSIPGTDEKLTDYVATRWYRSPELLVGSFHYGTEVDIFAIGCVMGEVVDGEPLLPGETELDQLSLIQNVIGPVSDEHQKSLASNPRFKGVRIPTMPAKGSKPKSLNDRYRTRLCSRGMSFLKSCLEPNHRNRISAGLAVRHPYFDSNVARSADSSRDGHRILRERRSCSNDPLCDILPPRSHIGSHTIQAGRCTDAGTFRILPNSRVVKTGYATLPRH